MQISQLVSERDIPLRVRQLIQAFNQIEQAGLPGVGYVVGPASSTDSAIARWDGTSGALLKDSGILIDASNNIAGVNDLSAITGDFSVGVASPFFTGDLIGTASLALQAVALQTPRNIWGQSFNGTADIVGALTGATTGSFSTSVTSPSFIGDLTGNADTVTNGVYTTGSYVDPTWLTSLAWGKITGTPTTIAGYGITDFNSLGDARWTQHDGTGATGTWAINISGSSASTTGNAATATALLNSRTIWGQAFDGTANVSGALSGATTGAFSGAVSMAGLTATTGAFSSTVTATGVVQTNTGFYLNAPVGANGLNWQDTNVNRFIARLETAGATWALNARDVAGASIDNPLSITIASGGAIAFAPARPVTMGALSATTGAFSGNVTIAGHLRMNGATLGAAGDINLRRSATEGYLYFGDDGNRYIGAASASFIFGSTLTSVRSVTDNILTLGDASYRFANTYSYAGNFAGTVTINNLADDKKMQFQRTGSDNLSIEFGTSNSSFYLYNETNPKVLFSVNPSTGAIVSGGGATINGNLGVSAAEGYIGVTATTGTNASYQQFINTAGNFFIGRDNTAGGLSGIASAHVLNGSGALPMVFLTSSTVRMTIEAAGGVTMTGGRLDTTQNSASSSALVVRASSGTYTGAAVYSLATRAASSAFQHFYATSNSVVVWRVGGDGATSQAARANINTAGAAIILNDNVSGSDSATLIYQSFQRGGVEKAWVGYGDGSNTRFRLWSNVALEMWLGTGAAGTLGLYTNGAERLHIASDGSIYANTTILRVTGLAGVGTRALAVDADGDLVIGTAGTGDVVGPGSATDDALATFDGATGKLIQNSTATLVGNILRLNGSANLLELNDNVSGSDAATNTWLAFYRAGVNKGYIGYSAGAGGLMNVANSIGPITIVSTSAAVNISTTAAAAITMSTNGSERINISSAGVVLISNLAGVGTRVVGADSSGNLVITSAGSGDVVGPGSATDNAVVRFNSTTGKLIQNSGVTIDDSNNITGLANITATGLIRSGASGFNVNGTAGTTVGPINAADYSLTFVGGILTDATLIV